MTTATLVFGAWRWLSRRGGAALVAAGIAAASASAALAIEPMVEDLSVAATYGSGVHSFFAADFDRAFQELSQVIEAGTGDPRPYYFRGLAALKLGRLDEAEADFSAGAQREAEGGAWPVARSLERVQGCDRLQLERHRRRARVASLQDSRRRRDLRYLEIEQSERDVQRKPRPVSERPADRDNPLDEPMPAEREAAPAEAVAPPAEPAAEPAEAAAPATEPAPAPAGDDPFGDLK